MEVRTVHRAVAVAACATALVGTGASAAAAGEITGKGKSLATVETGDPDFPLVIHGKSICAYSGLNDEYVQAQLNDDPRDDAVPPRVQTPAEAPPGIPGFACSPGRP